MIGAIAGDIIGSIYEGDNIATTEFPLLKSRSHFTDDTVLTIAIADSIMNKKDFSENLKYWALKYPKAGYGGSFKKWMYSDNSQPYNSWGNGSAMRVSSIGWFYSTLDETLVMAKQSAEVTHNHHEGIKGAQSTAAAIFLARNGSSKNEIKKYVENTFGYNLHRKLDGIRPDYEFDVSCQGSVPEAIIAFLESTDFESSIRLAVSLGGDSDTIACICGGIAEAYYKSIDTQLLAAIKKLLSEDILEIVNQFNEKE